MILLINPQSARWRFRVPLSVLSIAASIEGKYPYEILDGNLDRNLSRTILQAIESKGIKYVGFTVMPGPQLHQAITISRLIRSKHPDVRIIWGGYFPSLHKTVVLESGYVDYVIRDQGDRAFPLLIQKLENGEPLGDVRGLSYRDDKIYHNERQELIDPNELPPLPYERVPVARYIGRTYLGTRTLNYHSSVGCPFLCGFCAVAALYKARWIGLEADRVASDIISFNREHGVNAIEFADNNFFTSEKRTLEFSDRMSGRGIVWWGEGRPDTLMQYDDATWKAMKRSDCKMIFFGAESSSQATLDLMKKGGTQTPDTVLALAERMKEIGIIPEFSFVLGSPSGAVDQQLDDDFAYIRQIKKINPLSEIIIYVYSPVFFEDAELFEAAKAYGFGYPKKLDDWLLPDWRIHDLRKSPVTPWLKERHLRRIKNFERVLNARFPTVSDLKLRQWHRRTLNLAGYWRYQLSFYTGAYEIAALQRAFAYRQPELEGF